MSPVFFTYWEGRELSRLHYYTIYSLLLYNPGREVVIYTAGIPSPVLRQWSTTEHELTFEETITLEAIVGINPEKISLKKIYFWDDYGIRDEISCVYKADFTKIAKLYEHGGVWFDMDILFVRPFPAFIDSFEGDMMLFWYHGTIATGFLVGKAGCAMLTRVYDAALHIARTEDWRDDYQRIGPHLWAEMSSPRDKVVILSNDYVYPFLFNEIDDLFHSADGSRITEKTFGIHWYNGAVSTKRFINGYDAVDPERSLFKTLIRRLMDEKKGPDHA